MIFVLHCCCFRCFFLLLFCTFDSIIICWCCCCLFDEHDVVIFMIFIFPIFFMVKLLRRACRWCVWRGNTFTYLANITNHIVIAFELQFKIEILLSFFTRHYIFTIWEQTNDILKEKYRVNRKRKTHTEKTNQTKWKSKRTTSESPNETFAIKMCWNEPFLYVMLCKTQTKT